MKNSNNFTIYSLQIFQSVAETRSMVKSAKALGLSQPRVTQTILSLEEVLDTRLFDRSSRPLTLTPSGKLMLDYAESTIEETARLVSKMSSDAVLVPPKLTLAMTDSLDALFSAKILSSLGDSSVQWQFWSGLSPFQRESFLARDIDILVAGRSFMEDLADVERHFLFKEPYVIALPKSYDKPFSGLDGSVDLPFLRYSMRSAIGRRIELQLTRLRLPFPQAASFDSSHGHIRAIAAGYGWGITTPTCLLVNEQFLDKLQILPIERGEFSRNFELLARPGMLGKHPEMIAEYIKAIFKKDYLPIMTNLASWLNEDSFFALEEQDEPSLFDG